MLIPPLGWPGGALVERYRLVAAVGEISTEAVLPGTDGGVGTETRCARKAYDALATGSGRPGVLSRLTLAQRKGEARWAQ